jgi:hypothetical protein
VAGGRSTLPAVFIEMKFDINTFDILQRRKIEITENHDLQLFKKNTTTKTVQRNAGLK